MAQQLDIFTFSRQLIKSNDLDPVYVMLWNSDLMTSRTMLCRWLVAYWCFYHCGTACWIIDQPDYWQALAEAAVTKTHPRASERRHFRGQAAVKSVQGLRGLRLTPDQIVRGLGHSDERPTASEVMGRVKRMRGFGDWIAFKVADMLERLALCPVLFQPEDVFNMFDVPRKGAEEMAQRHGPCQGQSVYSWAYQELTAVLGTQTAPPRHERMLNIQEVETCLCKWKSHLNGHYEVGKDIHEVRHGLVRYGRCKSAQMLIRAGRKGGLWK